METQIIRGMEEIMEGNIDHAAVEMVELLASYEPLVNMDDLAGADKPCIFEIPETLKRHHETAYLPNAFSFGPLHYGKRGLEAGQAIKFRFLQDIFGGYRDPRTKLAEVESAVHGKLGEARQCYAKQVEILGDDEFVKILVLDGCFIIKFFFIMLTSNESDQFNAYQLRCLYHDLILLENQIPWSVLVFLCNLLYGEKGNPKPCEGAIRFFCKMFSLDGRLPKPEVFLEIGKIEHILDLLRNCFFLSFLGEEETKFSLRRYGCLPERKCSQEPSKAPKEQVPELEMQRERKFSQELSKAPKEQVPELEMQLPSASRLIEAGVKFERSRLRLDIKFQKGVLEIPSLLIHDTTETIFRNLIAFEQCYRDCPPIVTSYARFMDNLIDTVEDIDILHKNGIICNSLNPEDATKFFNSLYNSTYISRNHYGDIYREVNRYCQQWWPRWRAFYFHNYFGKPWAIFSQVFALLILALTILQVIHK